MGVITEPVLLCDECGRRIAPDSFLYNVYGGTLVRVENPAYGSAYPHINEVPDTDSYVHALCLRPYVQGLGQREDLDNLLKSWQSVV